jgi:glucose/arabinose dehydrogenase
MATAIAGTSGSPPGNLALPTTIEATRVAVGLPQPVFVAAPAGDLAHLFVVEKAGQIELLDLATNTLAPTPFLDLSGAVATAGEQGLLGLAFHPSYTTNGRLFVYLSNTAGDTEVREYHASADRAHADSASGRLILGVGQPDGLSNHKGGWIGFGPDGDLYIATGDGGGAGDPSGSGQDVGSLLGKMLRIDVDGGDAFPADPSRNYAIPPDNPFASGGGAPELWAWGLRNPWRASFDRATGELWIGDVGQDRFEEINLGAKGANYGWNLLEGASSFTPGADAAGLTPPLFAYGHELGIAVTGGYVYRGPGDALHGVYVFADFGSGRVFALARGTDGTAAADEITDRLAFEPGARLNSPTSFGEDAQGRLYVVDFDGEVFRLVPHATKVAAALGTPHDFTGDGSADLLWQDASGPAAIWSLSGLTVLATGIAGSDPGPSWHVIGARDFDADGRADILWQNDDGRAAVWIMNGTQLVSGELAGPNPGPTWHARGAHDFDGDGRADILWQHDDGQAAVWIMNGTQLVGSAAVGPNPGSSWRVRGAGDFDGDGRADILWQHDDGQAAVWTMNGLRLVSGAPAGPNPGPTWHAIAAYDVNADGQADIAWQNEDGQAAVWLMSGAQLLASGAVGANPGSSWLLT